MVLSHERREAIFAWAAATPEVARVRLVGRWFQGMNRPDDLLSLVVTITDQEDGAEFDTFENHVQAWQDNLSKKLDLQVGLQLYDAEMRSVGYRLAKSGAALIYPEAKTSAD